MCGGRGDDAPPQQQRFLGSLGGYCPGAQSREQALGGPLEGLLHRGFELLHNTQWADAHALFAQAVDWMQEADLFWNTGPYNVGVLPEQVGLLPPPISLSVCVFVCVCVAPRGVRVLWCPCGGWYPIVGVVWGGKGGRLCRWWVEVLCDG